MNDALPVISASGLLMAFVPVLAVLGVLYCWSLNYRNALYALVRMLIQLMLVGYCLTYVFNSESAELIAVLLVLMVLGCSWIALNTVSPLQRRELYVKALYSMLLGGGITLVVVTQGVVELTPWYAPRYMIPLASMIFANALNSVSLAAERFITERQRAASYAAARNTALHAALIPVINGLLAVGLVSLPGMMTGQILSGIESPVAARYQIMVMAMVFAASGLSTACFLWLLREYGVPSSSGQ